MIFRLQPREKKINSEDYVSTDRFIANLNQDVEHPHFNCIVDCGLDNHDHIVFDGRPYQSFGQDNQTFKVSMLYLL